MPGITTFADRSPIIRTIVPDGLTGYDQFNQLMTCYKDGDHETYTFIRDVRDKACKICQCGWENTTASLQNQFQVDRESDLFVHKTCYLGHLALVQRGEWLDRLNKVREILKQNFPFKITEIPNQYGGAWNTPWYEVELLSHDDDRHPIGIKLIIGRRKRVDSIEIVGLEKDFKDSFKDDDVTKQQTENGYLIHSYSKADAERYLAVFVEAAYDLEPKQIVGKV